MRLYKASEVAAILNCSLSNVYRLLDRGKLAYHHVGLKKGKRVAEADLQAYLAIVRREGEAKPSPAPAPRLRHLSLS